MLDEESRVCECAVGRRSEVLFCDPNMEFILLKVSASKENSFMETLHGE